MRGTRRRRRRRDAGRRAPRRSTRWPSAASCTACPTTRGRSPCPTCCSPTAPPRPTAAAPRPRPRAPRLPRRRRHRAGLVVRRPQLRGRTPSQELAEQFPLALIELTSEATPPMLASHRIGDGRTSVTRLCSQRHRSGHHRGAFGRTASRSRSRRSVEPNGWARHRPHSSGAPGVRKRGGTAALAHERDVVPVPERPWAQETRRSDRLPETGERIAELSRPRTRGPRLLGPTTTPSAPASTGATARRNTSSTTARRSPTGCRTTATC